MTRVWRGGLSTGGSTWGGGQPVPPCEPRENDPNRARGRLSLDKATVKVIGTTLAIQAALVLTGIASARLLGPEDRGWLGLVVAVAMSTSGIALLGFPSAITYQIASGRDSGFDSLAGLRGWVVAQFLGAVLVASLLGVVAFRSAPGQIYAWFLLLAVGTALLVGYQYLIAILQGRAVFRDFNIARSAMTVVYTFWVCIFLVLAMHPGAKVFATAWLSGLLVGTALAWWFARRGGRAASRKDCDARFVRSYGLRSFLGVRPPLEALNVDQLLIGLVGGPLVLGYYVVSTALTNLPRFIAESVGMVAFPNVAGADAEGRVQKARHALLLTGTISAVTVAVLAVAAPVIVPWLFGESFRPVISVMRIMLVASFFLSLRRILGDLLRGFGSPTPSSVAEVVAIAVFTISLVPLTRAYAADGAAMAYAAAAISSTAIVTLAYRVRVRRIQSIDDAISRG